MKALHDIKQFMPDNILHHPTENQIQIETNIFEQGFYAVSVVIFEHN